MNNGYYETLDENFTQALNLYEKSYTHDDLINFLKTGNIVQKQIAALRLETIRSTEDAGILLSNLTGRDGKIREAVSLKLSEFMQDERFLKYFQALRNDDIFLDAVVDINANICRNVISAISNLRGNAEFCENFCPKLVNLTADLLDIIERFDFQEGKYKVNKEVFKLYWCLETLYVFYDKVNFEDLKQIILRAKDINEYTIREKAAKILTCGFDDAELLSACETLKNDTNYYVRRYFYKQSERNK